jgi:secreted trypsin-like serine protease
MLVMLVVGALAMPAQAITNGTADGNRHPMVGSLLKSPQRDGSPGVYSTCTGTLISSTVFLTAAHCYFADRVSVSFEEIIDGDPGADVSYPGTMYVNPQYKQSTAYDYAVVVFDDPINGIAQAQLPPANFLSNQTLTSSTKFTSVGYGIYYPPNQPGGGGPAYVYDGTRRYSNPTYSNLTNNALHLSQKIKKGDGGTCAGDSGGPTFWGAGTQETTMVVSTTITGDTTCKSTNVTARLDTAAARSFLDDYVTVP